MKKMDISSAYALKRLLRAELKAYQEIHAICDAELKNVHPDDADVIDNINRERNYVSAVCLSLTSQLDDHQKDVVLSRR